MRRSPCARSATASACSATTRSTSATPTDAAGDGAAAGPLRGLRLVAFDLDNTLYDEGVYFAAAIDVIAPHIAAKCGVGAERVGARLDALLREKGRHYHHLFTDVLGELGLAERHHLDECLALFGDVRPALAPFPGVAALLADLRAAYRLGLVTSGRREIQENKLRLLGIAPLFEHVVFSSTLPENKPSPLPFRHLLAAARVAPAEAVYVGDNPLQDFKGANELGMVTVRVRNPEFDRVAVPPGWDAQRRVETVAELRGLLL